MRCALCVFALCLWTVHGEDREKRTIGFLFRGLVDAAANQRYATAAIVANQGYTTSPVSITTSEPEARTTTPKPERLRQQAPRPMIYIIPVTNKSSQSNDIQNLAEVLKYVKGPLKIKNENGSDPDLNALIQATKHLSVDKRNVAMKDQTDKNDDSEKKEEKKNFVIKIQAPRESNHSKEFSIRIVGDDVKVKKSKDGYTVGFSLPDSQANIRIEYPEKQFEKQEQAPLQQVPQQRANQQPNLPYRFDQFGFPGFLQNPNFQPTSLSQFSSLAQQFNQLYPSAAIQRFVNQPYTPTGNQQFPSTASQQFDQPSTGNQQFNQHFSSAASQQFNQPFTPSVNQQFNQLYPPTTNQQYPSFQQQYPQQFNQQYQDVFKSDPYRQLGLDQFGQNQIGPYPYDQSVAKSDNIACTSHERTSSQNCTVA